ncbi:hypothetical protein SAMN04489761_0298 [Tenacibaculum sp. MAR_2009_124]|uniref:DUF7151 family protein n=1 Tax=Tenacibaculum sp. MAR_2009_124 TaxID=1250059 RepID=UPI0008991FE0|nr:hypothetical protein [Tenacibaculum sp. MAR_2009_124]SEB37995.1 hypothetical protein SAMN04489761_0298 [Tenacibaculum sp. MAR_2009_124]
MKKVLILISLVFFFISCEDGKNGINGSNSLVKTSIEPKSINCPDGGIKIESGLDKNGNNILENEEVDKIDFICNSIGLNSLIKTTIIPSNDLCENGGIKLETGTDLNRNNELDESEITKTEYICNGANGLGYKQTRLLIYHGGASGGNYSGISSNTRFKLGELTRFDKKDWVEATSIIYNSIVKTDANNRAILELYNDTDNVLIAQSTITAENTEFEILESSNLINNFPNKEITVGLYIKSENNGSSVYFHGKSELIIEQ